MDTNDDKINNVLQFSSRLIDENHYAGDKIQEKAEALKERWLALILGQFAHAIYMI